MLPTLYCKKHYATREVLYNMLVLKLEKNFWINVIMCLY